MTVRVICVGAVACAVGDGVAASNVGVDAGRAGEPGIGMKNSAPSLFHCFVIESKLGALLASLFLFSCFTKCMSTVAEIKKAILTLPSHEVEKLATWWENFRAGKEEAKERARLTAIAATSGCLAGKESDDFEAAVAEAGQGIDEDHGW